MEGSHPLDAASPAAERRNKVNPYDEPCVVSPIVFQHKKWDTEIELRCNNNNKRSLDHCTVEWKPQPPKGE